MILAIPNLSGRCCRFCAAILLVVWLSGASSRPARAEPIDTCALPVATGGAVMPLPEVTTVTRVTGPNAFLTAAGHEIRLASVTTPHRFALGATTAEPSPTQTDAVAEQTIDADDPSDPETAEDVPLTDPIAAARSALGTLLVGQEIKFYPVTSEPDRYGRTRAAVVRISDRMWVEAELVTEGLARVQPQTDDFGCARHLEAVEAAARAAKRGLWSLPEFAVIEANDATRDRWVGHYVLIEGKVLSLGTSGTRKYLNFGRNFSRDFALVLIDKGSTNARAKDKRPPNRFQQEGFDAPAVAGKHIRVRGILTKGGGGLILPSLPEEIEWVPDQP